MFKTAETFLERYFYYTENKLAGEYMLNLLRYVHIEAKYVKLRKHLRESLREYLRPSCLNL
jgi:hypothetical protein